MTPSNSTIVLTLIMKDEADVIAHCLNSALPFVDAFAIVDTGSTDASIEIAEHVLRHSKKKIVQLPWRGYSGSRNDALDLAATLGDYALMIDADSEFVAADGSNPDTLRRQLTGPAHHVVMSVGGATYLRTAITHRDSGARYRGVLHEFVTLPDRPEPLSVVTGFRINNNVGVSARNKNPSKYLDDAMLIERELQNCEPDLVSRYTFYLAQSYRDAGELESALTTYERRITQAGWQEEVYYSKLMRAQLKLRLARPKEEIITAYLEAHELEPRRAEALYGLAAFARSIEHWQLAFMSALRVVNLREPVGSLFTAPFVYQVGVRFELSITCWYVGEFELGKRLCDELLDSGSLDDRHREATIRNRDFYIRRESTGPATDFRSERTPQSPE